MTLDLAVVIEWLQPVLGGALALALVLEYLVRPFRARRSRRHGGDPR